jgi:fused signal recognition particle receptor
MSGFFKKLFNRITGKPAEAAAVEEVVVPQIAAPEPILETVAPVKKTAVKKTIKLAPPLKKVVPKKAAPPPKKLPPPKPGIVKPSAIKKTIKTAPKKPVVKIETPIAVVVKPAPPPPLQKIKLPEPDPTPPPPPSRKGWLSRLTEGLSKSSKSITGSITAIFTKRKLDKATLEELEDVLIQADLGITVSERIIQAVSYGRFDTDIDPQEIKQILADEVAKVLRPVEVPFNFGAEKPFVILVVGVNGAGKTTTIGKLGSIATGEGFKVMFAACDTFRAAAIEQLTVWGQRIGAETMSRPTGADAAGLAYDAMEKAENDGTDILFIDTAGRLQNKAYLMDELDKVVRVIKKKDANAPHAVLLVLDATTGQNALAQAEVFTKVAGVTGLIMTKLDGTARGGILVAIAEKYKLPIHAIGVGEKIEDLQVFEADTFARAIAGLDIK